MASRYAHDLSLNPAAFRLGLPPFILRLAARAVPQPDLVIGLQLSRNATFRRMADLEQMAIDQYHNRLRRMAMKYRCFRVINADDDLDAVIAEVKHAILASEADRRRGRS